MKQAPESQRRTEEMHRERNSYLLGLVFALLLTIPIFVMVIYHLAAQRTIFEATGLAAIIQIVVHMRCFLHIRFKGQSREDLHLILFTAIILILMGGGTVWLMTNLASRM